MNKQRCTCGVWPPSLWEGSVHMNYCPLGGVRQASPMNAVSERDALVRGLRNLREEMKHDSRSRWEWDEIEAYLGGALSFDMDIDRILAILRGESDAWPAFEDMTPLGSKLP